MDVATDEVREASRARAPDSPALFEPECRTLEQMRMANAFRGA